MSIYKDGWHKISGYEIKTEDGMVRRGTIADRNGDPMPAYPYRWVKDIWVREMRLTVDAFRAGVKRGTIRMM